MIVYHKKNKRFLKTTRTQNSIFLLKNVYPGLKTFKNLETHSSIPQMRRAMHEIYFPLLPPSQAESREEGVERHSFELRVKCH